MGMLVDLLTPLSAWHWLAVALILLGIEMAVGTFDLLWVSVAAFITAAFSAFVPGLSDDWQIQLVLFFAVSVALVALGRTVFAGLRHVANEHPTLNKRMDSLIGRRGEVAADFSSGIGRVRIGDTEWSAEGVDGANFNAGDAIIVDGTESTTVKVRAA